MGSASGVNTPEGERYARLAGTALFWLATAALILAMPVFLVATNVRLAFNSVQLYTYGFERYDVTRTTGLNEAQLKSVATEFRDYFNTRDEFLDIRVVLDGEERPLFNQNELLHMRDVKGLVRGVYSVQLITGLYMLVYMAVVLAASRGRGLRRLSGRVLAGSVFTIGLVAAIGVASLVGFDYLFYQFHVISFSNDLWLLDPRDNYLTRLFTEGFFLEATIFVAAGVILQALLLGALAWVVRRWASRREALGGEAT